MDYDCERDREYDEAIEEMQREPSFGVLVSAAEHLENAIKYLTEAMDHIEMAAYVLDWTYEFDKVVSIENQVEDILEDITSMKQKFERGERG